MKVFLIVLKQAPSGLSLKNLSVDYLTFVCSPPTRLLLISADAKTCRLKTADVVFSSLKTIFVQNVTEELLMMDASAMCKYSQTNGGKAENTFVIS